METSSPPKFILEKSAIPKLSDGLKTFMGNTPEIRVEALMASARQFQLSHIQIN